jgi:TPR repeat protein
VSGPVRLPYPGLRPFKRDETDLFFGREACVDEMVGRLSATRFLAVLGPSGSGKSSLVRTGLLEALELGLMAGAGPRWLIAEMRPGGRPIENLARALLRTPGGEGNASEGNASEGNEEATLASRLQRGPRSVIQWCREGSLPARTNLLILVDQFEELFRYADYAGHEDAERFVALLLESAAAEHVPIYVALTMRSEFLGPCALFPNLAERINAGLYLVRRMTREEMRAAIEGPAGVCGFTIDRALVNRLLNDLASFAPWEDERGIDQLQLLARRADQLPVLQHVLNRLWLRARSAEPDGTITLRLADYEALGGLVGALNAHAEEVLASIGPEHEATASAVFRAMVSGSTVATVVRRHCSVDELVRLAGGDRAGVERVVEAFRAPECNFLVADRPGPLTPETVIDISHESLIRQWSRLRQWAQDEARAADEYRDLEKSASRWQEGHGALLGKRDLDATMAWWERERPNAAWAERYGGNFALTAQYLEKSKRGVTIQRFSRGAYGSFVLLFLVAGSIIAYQYWRNRTLLAATQADLVGTSYMLGESASNGRQDYVLAMVYFRKAAKLGSLDGAYRVGYLYERGYGVKKDYGQAVTWYGKAAGKGYAAAENDLGYLYDYGLGVPQDNATAAGWYAKAAAQGDATAEYNLGWDYDNGVGVKRRDSHMAAEWYQKAADQGDEAAETNLGYLYEHGRGVKQDYAKAAELYRKAADQGDEVAENNLGYFYEHGFGVKQDYAKAAELYRKAADQGAAMAQYHLGYLYEHGLGVDQDNAMAADWYRQAADQADPAAQAELGYLYEHGLGVRQDYAEAAALYRKAAERGNSVAQFDLGYLYEKGRGVRQDYAEAAEWYRKAALQGDQAAETNLGYLYEHGLGVKQDYAEAAEWYRKAALQGDADAAYNLGVLYDAGHGVRQSDAEAMEWFAKDAAAGDPDGEREIGKILAREGKYDEALAAYRKSVQLAQAVLVKTPSDPSAKEAIHLVAEDIGSIAYEFLLKGEFQKALDTANLSIGLAPGLIWLRSNRADALMMLGKTDEARALYLQFQGSKDAGNGQSWNDGVLEDFAALRKKGFSSPLMAEIEAAFGRTANKADPKGQP